MTASSLRVDEKALPKGAEVSSLLTPRTLLQKWQHPVIPPELQGDPEMFRHALLITRFGQLGTVFGLIYAGFYLLIGHYWGALIIVACTAGVLATPSLMRATKSISLAGNFFSMTLVLGFLGLSFIEGGVHGHAIAWLVSVPLCALILLGQREAITWVVISFLAAALVAGLDLAGIDLPTTYDPKWNSLISAAGYLGLVAFMFILGLIFERGRVNLQAKLQLAVKDLAASMKNLAASNERLVYLNQEKTEFMGIAAHDLRTPLTVILGNAELMRMLKDPKQTDEMTGTIITSVERMRALISNLLDVNMIEEGKFASRVEACDVDALTLQSMKHYLTAATQKEIKFEFTNVKGVCASADVGAATQIIDNLVSNAVKYSSHKTTIHINSREEEDFAVISVRDEGPGISAEDQKKLFQKFSRLSAKPTGGESSTGLGLAIVKRFAEAMSGSVACESVLGQGATFTLRLPLYVKAR